MRRSQKFASFATGSALFALVSFGCIRTMAPKLPPELRAPTAVSYSQRDFESDTNEYRKAAAGGDMTRALLVRNQIAYRVMGDIESSYGQFETKLTTNRAGIQTTSDAIQLGMSAASTVIAGTDIKDLLNASLSAFKGTSLSFDKNYFQEKTTEALISQMRASRQTLQARLLLSLGTRDVASYPFEAVWIDLVDYYYSGTVPSALVAIATKAGSDANQASAKVDAAVKALTPATPAQAKQSVDIRAAYTKIASELGSPDPIIASTASQILLAILQGAGYNPLPTATGQDLLSLFRQAMHDASTDDAKLAALSAAVQTANIK